MTATPAARSRGLTRRGLAALAGACLPGAYGIPPVAASSVDGRGISNADVLAGFRALHDAPIQFQDGRRFTLEQFRGRALLVNFWANWCTNCLAELHSMGQLQQAAGGSSQFAVVLVSQPQDWAKDQALARQSGIPFPLAVVTQPATPAGVAATATLLLGTVVSQSPRYGLPVCYMASRSGQVVLAGAGGMDWVGQNAMAKAAQALRA